MTDLVDDVKAELEDFPNINADLDNKQRLIVFTGSWTKNTIGKIENQARIFARRLIPLSYRDELVFDLTQVKDIDVSGAYFISYIMGNNPKECTSIFGSIKGEDTKTYKLVKGVLLSKIDDVDEPEKYSGIALFGKNTLEKLNEMRQELISTIAFIGETMFCFVHSITTPEKIRWVQVVAIAESAGFNAIPIVMTLTFFIGAVVTFMGAQTLKSFGATIFAVDLLGISILREFAVLITAIILAGRSDSAFTAQIGSMKMTQEIDAMQTIGLRPMEILVVPRVLALLGMTPILTFFAILAGLIGGGLVCVTALHISPILFLSRLQENVGVNHFWTGIAKAPVFAFIIAIIGCRQGLLVENDVISLGQKTTASVVQAIFMVIVVDAIFAMIYQELNI